MFKKKIVSIILSFILLLSFSISNFALFITPYDSGGTIVQGESLTTYLSGSGYSGYATTWKYNHLDTLVYDVGFQTYVTFANTTSGASAAAAIRDSINTNFARNSQTITAILTFLSFTPIGSTFVVALGGAFISAQLNRVAQFPQINAGDRLMITYTCRQNYAAGSTPISQTTMTLYNSQGVVRSSLSFYN